MEFARYGLNRRVAPVCGRLKSLRWRRPVAAHSPSFRLRVPSTRPRLPPYFPGGVG